MYALAVILFSAVAVLGSQTLSFVSKGTTVKAPNVRVLSYLECLDCAIVFQLFVLNYYLRC